MLCTVLCTVPCTVLCTVLCTAARARDLGFPSSASFFPRSSIFWDLAACAAGLADTDVPRGQLDKDEFFLACKLVALAQAGKPLDGGPVSLATKVPLPKLGQLGADSSA